MSAFTAREKADCAKREIGFRRYAYGRRVADGKMKQAEADKQIALMEEIEADYRALADAEEAKGRLL